MTEKKHKNVYAALAAAQMEMGKAIKDAENPHFRSRYADLSSVVDAVRPALNAHGIAFFHVPQQNEFGHAMDTILYHGDSETEIKATVPLILGKQDMQGYKSATTYAKRIGLESVTGIAPDDDDDGNAAVETTKGGKSMGVKSEQGGKPLTWSQEVLKDLPPTATDQDKARALTDAVIGLFKRKKSKVQLENEWDRRKDIIDRIQEKFPDMHGEIIEAYSMKESDLPSEDAIPVE